MTAPFLLYGSYGYTGQLIAELAVQRGLRPLLAGRDATRLKAQADTLDLEYRAFPVEDVAALESALRETSLVLHAAGPFSHTYRVMASTCLSTQRHYLDITGEIPVFEGLAALNKTAHEAGVMLLPGTGFDVVPSDCLANHLKRRLPDATHLVLAIHSLAGISQGTTLTMLEGMHLPGAVRRNGRLEAQAIAAQQRSFDFGSGPRMAVSIPWGDISTAYHSTGIPNIDVFMTNPPAMVLFMRFSRYISPLLGSRPVQALMRQLVKSHVSGPTAEIRRTGRSVLFGEATNAAGQKVSASLETPEAYGLTAQTALLIVEKIMQGQVYPGFQTPAKAYGPDLILEIPKTKRVDLD